MNKMVSIIIAMIFFSVGYLFAKLKDKISEIMKNLFFYLRNYNTIRKSKYYNEFYEDYISSRDYERSLF